MKKSIFILVVLLAMFAGRANAQTGEVVTNDTHHTIPGAFTGEIIIDGSGGIWIGCRGYSGVCAHITIIEEVAPEPNSAKLGPDSPKLELNSANLLRPSAEPMVLLPDGRVFPISKVKVSRSGN
ncbi:MAG: hypothetical protein LBL90_00415 [Prevotellaceae bacterium]|jgi:hypothetical protein|nr:hypothetical protein [Prevotellaceae bacterium]